MTLTKVVDLLVLVSSIRKALQNVASPKSTDQSADVLEMLFDELLVFQSFHEDVGGDVWREESERTLRAIDALSDYSGKS